MNPPPASLDQIAPDTWRISIPLPPGEMPGGFSFNQYLVIDEKPLLFHTGPRRMFELVRAQIEKLLPLQQLRYIGFSHVEADECGSLAEFLSHAPQAQPVCSRVAAMVWVSDQVDAEPVAMNDGDTLDLGRHKLTWVSTPHLPHGWECGYLFDRTTRTLFCGDLLTQPGTGALSERDLLEESEAFRRQEDYFSHGRDTAALIEKLARLEPRVLACMHGSAWQGDGASMLRRLARSLDGMTQ